MAVAGKDIANLAEAATEGGWTRASLPTAAAEIDAESDNVLPVEDWQQQDERGYKDISTWKCIPSPPLKLEPKPIPPGSPLRVFSWPQAGSCVTPVPLQHVTCNSGWDHASIEPAPHLCNQHVHW